MSAYYQTCYENMGKPVCIRTRDGKEYRGVIRQVTRSHVYLEPLGGHHGGYGWGFWGPGFGLGIALGAIGTLAILPWFFI
ncbi:hypothetical protein [Amphibacillus cookii]|uniref:hypothetical protein n=1 Tax=Amphibacillus cookii TaxID=767787 RepID=UPI001958DC9A|nr:hypothetical protein [Amphibacillus cookii]MBM7540974.1 hypothetical protein [Amphibacillus cookii]